MNRNTSSSFRKDSLAGFFLLFFAAAFFNRLAFSQTLLSERPVKQAQGQRGLTLEERVHELSLRLNLSEEQAKKITSILTKSKENTSKLIEDASEKIKVLKAKAEADVENVLTKEQRRAYKKAPAPPEEKEDTVLKVFKGSR